MSTMHNILRAMADYERRSDDPEPEPEPSAAFIAWAEAHQDNPEGDALDAAYDAHEAAVTGATAADWQEAWAQCDAAQRAHPSYDSGERQAARALKHRLSDDRALPSARWLATALRMWEHASRQPYAIYQAPAFYAEGTAFVRAFIAQWCPEALALAAAAEGHGDGASR